MVSLEILIVTDTLTVNKKFCLASVLCVMLVLLEVCTICRYQWVWTGDAYMWLQCQLH